jgi:hypothetical protein
MPRALRLTFEFDSQEMTLKSVRRLEMRVPPGQSARDMARPLAGHFVEVRAETGAALYRRSISGLIPDMVEYRTGDPARPFGRAVAIRKRSMSVLVPALEKGRSVAIVQSRGSGAKNGSINDVESETRELFAASLADLEKI